MLRRERLPSFVLRGCLRPMGLTPLRIFRCFVRPERATQVRALSTNAFPSCSIPRSSARPSIKPKKASLRVGDKVIQTRNNYDVAWTSVDGKQGSGVFNGDIGILQSIDRATGILCVRFGDKIALYSSTDADDLDKAFAVTVHKSQGSEYNCVIIPTVGIPPQLMFRNLLYTGVTRAKKAACACGNRAVGCKNGRKTTERPCATPPFPPCFCQNER